MNRVGCVVVLAFVAVLSGCTSGQSADSSAGSEPPITDDRDSSASAAEEIEPEEQPEGLLPEGYEAVAAGPVDQFGPDDGLAIKTVVAVGTSRSDPRFLEYTVFDYRDAASAEVAAEFTGPIDESGIVQFDQGQFAFVVGEGAELLPMRSLLQLLPTGPSVNASFRSRVGERSVLIGGSSVLQPTDVQRVVDLIAAGEEPGPEALPERMSILVNDTPPEGRFVEVNSDHGAMSIVEYRDVDPEWFDHATWGDPDPPKPAELTGLADKISIQPPSQFGFGGAAEDPVRLSILEGRRLIVIDHPATVPPNDVATLVSVAIDEPRFEALTAEAGGSEVVAEGEPADSDRVEPLSEAPSAEDLAAFQRFAEERTGTERGQPISFDFVPDFPTDDLSIDFISWDLWLVASALGLSGEGRTFEEANQARIDAIRGTPGVIALQPTQVETDVVVVHEMVHLLEPTIRPTASQEMFSMTQVVSEGNAHRVAYEYLQTLEPAEQKIMEPFPDIFPMGGDQRISPAVQDLLEFAYDEGRLFMAAAVEAGGLDGAANVFRRPPTSSEQVLFFDAWLTNDEPTPVPTPPVPEGGTIVGDGSLGAYLLLLVAAEVGDPAEARELVSQWAGDSYVLYEAGPAVCVSAALLFDSADAAARYGEVVGSRATALETDDDVVSAEFCSAG